MAGTWYPGDAASLRAQLTHMMQQARLAGELPVAPDAHATLVGLQVPHAGYFYSGITAALAFASLGEWRPRRVVVLAPSHRELVQGVGAWSPITGHAAAGQWETPLGQLTVDEHFLQQLGDAEPLVSFGPAGHGQEHALELQLPFLQFLGMDEHLVPLCVGSQEENTVLALARALHELLARLEGPTLVVASSDLSHFHPLQEARRLDEYYLRLLVEGDARALLGALREGSCEACGGGPVAALLELFRLRGQGLEVKVLDWRTSALVTHDDSSVVGYAAARLLEDAHD